MSNVDGKIMASSFWSHIVCFMFMSIWFSTMCFTAFSIVSFHVHVVQHTVLKFILSTKVFKYVFQIICQPCCIFLACSAKLHMHKNCAMEGGSHGMCIALLCILFCRSHHQRMMRHGQQSQMNANHVSISPSGSS